MNRRRGFTLVEVIATLTIAAILTLMAAAAFQSWSQQIKERQARTYATQVINAQVAFAASYGAFTPDPDDVNVGETAVVVVSDAAVAEGEVSIAVDDTGMLAVSSWITEGQCNVGVLDNPSDTVVTWSTYAGLCDASGHLNGAPLDPTDSPAG